MAFRNYFVIERFAWPSLAIKSLYLLSLAVGKVNGFGCGLRGITGIKSITKSISACFKWEDLMFFTWKSIGINFSFKKNNLFISDDVY